LTLYVRIENVMHRESVFITWDHNGTSVKYLPCAFERINVLDVSNLLEDLLYENIPTKFRVYNT
jgi:cell division FtsZ-interacting protein ZapD